MSPPEDSDSAKTALDALQTALDWASLADPTPFSDLANGLLHAARGRYGDAALSFANALLPSVLGGVAKLGKNALKGVNALGETIDVAGDAAKLAKQYSPDQRALQEIIDQATLGGRKALSAEEAETVLDWAQEVKYPGVRAGPKDVTGAHGKGPHIHVPHTVKGGHVPVESGVRPRTK